MKVNVSRQGIYIPKWEGNRKLEESDQMVVEHEFLSHEQRRRYVHVERPNYSIEVAGKSDKEIEEQLENQTRMVQFKAWDDKEDIAIACKPKIKNLEDEDGNAIDTWDKLLKAPQTKENQLSVLVAEITDYLSDLSKEKDSKNSE